MTNVFQVSQSGVLDDTKSPFASERTIGENIVNDIVIEINTMHLQVKFFSVFSPDKLKLTMAVDVIRAGKERRIK